MAISYRDKLDKSRLAFPQPVSDRVHDSYFVHSIMRALDEFAMSTSVNSTPTSPGIAST